MVLLIIVAAVFLPLLLAAAFLLGRAARERSALVPPYSPVTRQHFEIFQTGHVNEAAVEAAKTRFRALLERGEIAKVEASLRPGMQYVFQVRALAEIGTDMAGGILERQLQRRLTDDQLEQSWYWIDLAGSLRALQREESLPQLLRCADAAVEAPLGHFFAAETVCFLGFAGYLRQPDGVLGRSALKLLHRALEGLRYGVQPAFVIESRLGEILENLWEKDLPAGHPLLARVAFETLRFLRRAEHGRRLVGEEQGDREAFDWQVHRMTAVESQLREYLDKSRPLLAARLNSARSEELADILGALDDLRIDAGTQLLARLRQSSTGPQRELTVAALTWSKNEEAGVWLRSEAQRLVPMTRRARKRRRLLPPRKPSVPVHVPYRMMLRALRGHASIDTERFLVLAAQDWDPTYRIAALSSFGWWEPLDRRLALECLEEGRRDPCYEVRQAARAALARLGERQALHWFRQGLSGEDPSFVHEAIQAIAQENLFLLWPDLDRLADSENLELAHHAREALERLAEELHGPNG